MENGLGKIIPKNGTIIPTALSSGGISIWRFQTQEAFFVGYIHVVNPHQVYLEDGPTDMHPLKSCYLAMENDPFADDLS